MTQCSICLDTINDKDEYNLSCNHLFHKKCYLTLIINHDFNIFINCPLCRDINIKNNKIYDLSYDNINFFCPIQRCSHKTKKGNRCKNKSYLLNYGYCYQHNKEVLPREKYDLLCDYIYWLLEPNNTFRTKIYMIDIAKKLCIKYPEIKTIQQIQHYFYRFYHHNKKEKTVMNNYIYDFYHLKYPPGEWITTCITKKKL